MGFLSCCAQSVSHGQLFVTPWTVACQDPLSMGFSQARIPEWAAIPISRGSSWPKDWTCICFISCTGFWDNVIKGFLSWICAPGKAKCHVTRTLKQHCGESRWRTSEPLDNRHESTTPTEVDPPALVSPSDETTALANILATTSWRRTTQLKPLSSFWHTETLTSKCLLF